MSYDEYDAADESDDTSDLGGADGKPPISLKQTEFSLKQFAKWTVQANNSAFNKWKKVWVAGFLEKKHRSIIRGQNRLKQVRDGPLHWETAVADFLATFETWLPLVNIDNAEWIRRQWVEMFLKKCASENSGGEEKGKARQQVTGDEFGRARGQKGEEKPPRVAKYNVHGYDSLGVEWQGYGSSPQTTASLVHRCEALGGVG